MSVFRVIKQRIFASFSTLFVSHEQEASAFLLGKVSRRPIADLHASPSLLTQPYFWLSFLSTQKGRLRTQAMLPQNSCSTI